MKHSSPDTNSETNASPHAQARGKNLIGSMLNCPVFMFASITVFSIIALASALYSEVALGLEPCILCIYQRIPYVIAIILGITGLTLRKHSKAVIGTYIALSLNFFANSAIAFYHTGVEQKWWVSGVEGCSAPNFTDISAQSVLENILSAPTGNCADIPWQDPIFGLSMANYNVALCFGIGAVFAIACVLRARRH